MLLDLGKIKKNMNKKITSGIILADILEHAGLPVHLCYRRHVEK